MQAFLVFLASDIGKILALALLFVGMTDICIARFLFGKIVREAEAQILPVMSPEQQKPLLAHLRAKQIVRKTLTATGVFFIMFGIFGLTR